MKVLIAGASGFIGSYFYRFYKDRGDIVVGTSFKKGDDSTLIPIDFVDISKTKQLMSQGNLPDVVINTVAQPNVDYCEAHPVESWKGNFLTANNIEEVCSKKGIKHIFISTDYVFSGKDRPPKGYTETSQPNPINMYGRHKLEAENIVLKRPGNLVIRTTVVYGWESPEPKNFFHTLVNNLREKKIRNVPIDQEGSPTYVSDLVTIVAELIDKKATGIYNVSGPEIINRYDFAKKIASIFSENGDYSNIHPISTVKDIEGLKWSYQTAERGEHLGLDISKTSKMVKWKPLAPLDAIARLHKIKYLGA